MKRSVAFLLILLVITSFALADNFDDFLIRYNKITHIYSTPELSYDMFALQNGMYSVSKDEWKVIVSSDTSQAGVSSKNGDTFLAFALTLASAIVTNKTVETYSQFQANLLDMYLRVVAGDNQRSTMFGGYTCMVENRNNKLIFTMVK